jgi:hypothetical protein
MYHTPRSEISNRQAGAPPESRRRRPRNLLLAALLCIGLCLSCSDDPSASFSTVCLELLAEEGNAGGGVYLRTGTESTCNDLVIEVVAANVSGIFTAELQLTYPNSLAIVVLAEAGPLLLESGDASVACAQALSQYGVDCLVTDDFGNGTVDLAISRTATQTPGTVDAPAEGAVLARLTFLQLLPTDGQGTVGFPFGKLQDDGEGGTTAPVILLDAQDAGSFAGGQMVTRTQ